MLVTRVIEGLRSVQAVKTSLRISDGISGHRQHRRSNLLWSIGDTRDIELTIDLLRSYFFGEVIDTLHILRAIGLSQYGVQAQITMDAQPYSELLDHKALPLLSLRILEVVVLLYCLL